MVFSQPLTRFGERFRLLTIYFAALSVSLPMAWISLAKVTIFLVCLIFLVTGFASRREDSALQRLWSAPVILLIVMVFALDLAWSSASPDIALTAFVKHGKLLEIVMLVGLIRTTQEARSAIAIFIASQVILLASSWALAAGISIPWATGATDQNAVFSTYLDQSIMFAASAAVFWHLRNLWPRNTPVFTFLAIAALGNTLFLLAGRTGYAVALAVITLAVMWKMPSKLRLAALVIAPAIILVGAYLGSGKVKDRLSAMVHESQNYASQGAIESSSGFRLAAWKRSIQAIAEKPLTGHGIGSWTITVKRIEGSLATQVFGDNNSSNPHQEYLLWGVELGLGGTLLLLALFLSLIRDANLFSEPVRRATISVVAAMAVACLFNSSLYDALIGDFFCVALGLLIALGVRTSPTSSEQIASAPDSKSLKVAR